MAGIGGAWIGKARHGLAWIGKAWAVSQRQGQRAFAGGNTARIAKAWLGPARHGGPERRGKELATASFTACCEWEWGKEGRGWARRGKARSGTASQGLERHGTARAFGHQQENVLNAITELHDITNGGDLTIEASQPYRIAVQLTGTADLLFHRWNSQAVDEKAKAAKNSKAKKSDDIESYVYRNDDGELCIPGEYVRQAIVMAAKFRQDPRSPRKSAMDLYKAGVVPLSILASTGKKDLDYEDTRRVVVQRAGINRTRPAIKAGWKAEFEFLILTPEYIAPMDLHGVLTQAGVLVGIADFRPTFGRFGITSFEVLQ